MHQLLFTTALLALLCGWGCQKDEDTSTLENTDWRLEKFVAGAVVDSVPTDVVITARFTAGQLTGNAGCNDYQADYMTTGDQLSIATIDRTLVVCPAIAWEDRYFAILQVSQAWEITGDVLTVQAADTSLVFKKQ